MGLTLADLPADIGMSRTVARGTSLWDRGQSCESVFFLRRGQVCIVVEETGHEVVARIVRPGEPFGLTCFSEPRRRTQVATAVAAIDSEVVEIGAEAFRTLVIGNLELASALLYTMSERLAYAEERIRILSNHDAEDRICALLEQVVQRMGRPSRRNPSFSAVQFTHAQLAELSGLSRAHVSIIMGRLRRKGVVEYSRTSALLVDLVAIADRRINRG